MLIRNMNGVPLLSDRDCDILITTFWPKPNHFSLEYPKFLFSLHLNANLPHCRLKDIQCSIVLASSQDVEFVVEETDAVSEAGWLGDLCVLFPVYASEQAGTTVELLSEPQGPTGDPLLEIFINSITTH